MNKRIHAFYILGIIALVAWCGMRQWEMGLEIDRLSYELAKEVQRADVNSNALVECRKAIGAYDDVQP